MKNRERKMERNRKKMKRSSVVRLFIHQMKIYFLLFLYTLEWREKKIFKKIEDGKREEKERENKKNEKVGKCSVDGSSSIEFYGLLSNSQAR